MDICEFACIVCSKKIAVAAEFAAAAAAAAWAATAAAATNHLLTSAEHPPRSRAVNLPHLSCGQFHAATSLRHTPPMTHFGWAGAKGLEV
jgi:hypothetical protein